MNIQLPPPVRYAMNTLVRAGHQAYVVGGSVRDVLLGKEPHDYDLTTSALPEEMLELFSRDKMLTNGMKHGTVTLIKYGTAVEMTTFRIDGEYSDGRHPDDVEFTGNLYEDVMRRDLTINALCWNPQAGLIDYVDGEDDIRNGIIRCVGDAERRFSEDALRILRALRFSATLDFDIDPSTVQSALHNREALEAVAVERILVETKKLLAGPRAEQVLLEFRPVFEVFLPEVKALTDDQYMQAARRVSLTAPAPDLRLAAFLYGLPAEAIHECASRLRFSKATRKLVEFISENASRPLPLNRAEMRRLIGEVGEEMAYGLIEIREADMKAMCHLVIQMSDCVNTKQLAVSAEDVFRAGVSRRKVSPCMSALLDAVIEDRLPNEREALLEAAKEQYASEPQAPGKKKRRRKKAPAVHGQEAQGDEAVPVNGQGGDASENMLQNEEAGKPDADVPGEVTSF